MRGLGGFCAQIVPRQRLRDPLRELECPRLAQALSAPLLAAERRGGRWPRALSGDHLSLLKTRFERIDDEPRQGSDAQQSPNRTKGGHFPARMGSSNRLGGPFRDVFIRAKFQAQGQTGSF